MEPESMSSVLASVSTRKEKAAKAMASLHSHRNLLTSCITDWEELERSFGVTERALQQKFKELAEREKEFDNKMKDAQAALDKREQSISGREEASVARVREQRDSAVAAILEERKKLEEEQIKVRGRIKETVAQGKNDGAPAEKPPKDASTAADQIAQIAISPIASKESKDGQSKKDIVHVEAVKKGSSISVHHENKKEKKPVEQGDVDKKKEGQKKEVQKKGGDEPSNNKRKDNTSLDEAAPKRQKETSLPEANTPGIKNPGLSNGATSLEEAIKQVKLLAGAPTLVQIKTLIEKKDGVGLKEFLVHHRKDFQKLRPELHAALQASSDPCHVVLKVLDGSEGINRVSENNKVCHACILLLECLAEVVADPVLGIDYPVVPSDVKEQAKTLARRWKSKLEAQGQDGYTLDSQLFLQLVATFGVGTEFNVDNLLGYVVSMSRRGIGPALCRTLGLAQRIPVLVDKLVKEGKQIEAIAFSASFGILDKVNPEMLLKSYLEDSQKAMPLDKVPPKGGVASDPYTKQITALKNAVKVIEEYKLDSRFPLEDLRKRIAVLTQEKADQKKASTIGKQDKKSEKSSQECQPGRPSGATNSADELDTRSGVPMGHVSTLDRGIYTPTDLGRSSISGYISNDRGQPFLSSYDSELRYKYERMPESVFPNYGLGSRSPVSLSKSHAYPPRDGFLSGSASHLPAIHSYRGRSRDEIGSHGRPNAYPEIPSASSSYHPGSGLPPPSYLPYYLR